MGFRKDSRSVCILGFSKKSEAEPTKCFRDVQSWYYTGKLSHLYVWITGIAVFWSWTPTAGGLFEATELSHLLPHSATTLFKQAWDFFSCASSVVLMLWSIFMCSWWRSASSFCRHSSDACLRSCRARHLSSYSSLLCWSSISFWRSRKSCSSLLLRSSSPIAWRPLIPVKEKQTNCVHANRLLH